MLVWCNTITSTENDSHFNHCSTFFRSLLQTLAWILYEKNMFPLGSDLKFGTLKLHSFIPTSVSGLESPIGTKP